MCIVGMGPRGERTTERFLAEAQMPDAEGPLVENVFDTRLGDVPAKAKKLSAPKDSTRFQGTSEFRFALRGPDAVTAFCMYTQMSADPEADLKSRLQAGRRAVEEFWKAFTLPAH